MSSTTLEAPLYTPQEKAIIKLVSTVPKGYVTSAVAIATTLCKQAEKPRNGASNVHKSLKNLVGRTTIPAHRVLRNAPRTTKRVRLIVREPAHIAVLRGEGVDIDDLGRLKETTRFWDFSPACENAYREKIAAEQVDKGKRSARRTGYRQQAEKRGITDAQKVEDYVDERESAWLEKHGQKHLLKQDVSTDAAAGGGGGDSLSADENIENDANEQQSADTGDLKLYTNNYMRGGAGEHE